MGVSGVAGWGLFKHLDFPGTVRRGVYDYCRAESLRQCLGNFGASRHRGVELNFEVEKGVLVGFCDPMNPMTNLTSRSGSGRETSSQGDSAIPNRAVAFKSQLVSYY